MGHHHQPDLPPLFPEIPGRRTDAAALLGLREPILKAAKAPESGGTGIILCQRRNSLAVPSLEQPFGLHTLAETDSVKRPGPSVLYPQLILSPDGPLDILPAAFFMAGRLWSGVTGRE